jgi:hypothetical protein
MSAINLPNNYRQFSIAAKSLRKFLWTLDLNTRLFVAKRVASTLVVPQLFRPSARLLISLLAERSPVGERHQIAAPICEVVGEIPEDELLKSIGGWCSLVSHIVRAFEGEQCPSMSPVCFFLYAKAQENAAHYLHYAFFVFSAVCRSGNLEESTANTLLMLATDAIQRTRSHFDCCAALKFLKEAFRLWSAQVTEERVGFLIELWRTIRPMPVFQSCVDYLSNIFLIIGDRLPPPFTAEVLEAFPPRAERCLTAEMCGLLRGYFGEQREDAVRVSGARACVRLAAAGSAIRYCHRIEFDEVALMIRLGLALVRSVDADVITGALPERTRAQERVRQWFDRLAEEVT